MYKDGDIVKHATETQLFGIVHSQVKKVHWFYPNGETCVSDWAFKERYLTFCTETVPLAVQQKIKNKYGNSLTQEERIIKKIKELDTKWELRMKAKATSSPTNPVQNVEVRTTSPYIPTDTSIASDVSYTYHNQQLFQNSVAQIGQWYDQYIERVQLNRYQLVDYRIRPQGTSNSTE